MFIILYSLKF